MDNYTLPYLQKSSIKWYYNAIHLVVSLISAIIVVLVVLFLMPEDFASALVLSIFFVIISIFFFYMFIFTAVQKKLYLEVTSEYILLSLPLKDQKAYWRDIANVNLNYLINGASIGILLEKDKVRKSKKSLLNALGSMPGVPPFSFQIPMKIFKGTDAEKLMATIENQLRKAKGEV